MALGRREKEASIQQAEVKRGEYSKQVAIIAAYTGEFVKIAASLARKAHTFHYNTSIICESGFSLQIIAGVFSLSF